MPQWFVYVLECRGGRLYTGIATDVARRYAEHAAGTGARFTRAHPPMRLVGVQAHADRSEASRAEYAIKQLSPTAKRALCAQWASTAEACAAPTAHAAHVPLS